MNIHVDTIIAGTPQEIHGKKTLILFSSVIRDICKIKKKFVVEKDIYRNFLFLPITGNYPKLTLMSKP